MSRFAKKYDETGLNELGKARLRARFSKARACAALHIDHRRLRQLETEKLPETIRFVRQAGEIYGDLALLDKYLGQFLGRQICEKDLSTAVLGVLAASNSLQKAESCLIEITADGIISKDEQPRLQEILEILDTLIGQVESLRLCAVEHLHERGRAA